MSTFIRRPLESAAYLPGLAGFTDSVAGPSAPLLVNLQVDDFDANIAQASLLGGLFDNLFRPPNADKIDPSKIEPPFAGEMQGVLVIGLFLGGLIILSRVFR